MDEILRIVGNERLLQGFCCASFAAAGALYVWGPEDMIPSLIVVGAMAFIGQFYYHKKSVDAQGEACKDAIDINS